MTSSTTETASPHGRRLRWGFLAIILAILIAYVISYCMISHRGVKEAVAEGRPAFYYVSSDEYCHSATGRKMHFRLSRLYAPLNWIDTTFLGGMPVVRGGIRKLTGAIKGPFAVRAHLVIPRGLFHAHHA